MLAEPTVFVLGAGASADFGLPVGSQLAVDLRRRLSFHLGLGADQRILGAYSSAGTSIGDFMVAAEKIAAALPGFKSIDDCLHTHKDNKLGVLAGKMAIASAIADAERGSTVAQLWQNDARISLEAREQIQGGWAGALVRILVTGFARTDFRDVFRKLTIVSFNYDRCIESILYMLIQKTLDISPQEAAEAMKGLTVFHPYGSLGRLQLDDGDGIPFAPPSLDLLEATKGLYVYTEARDQPEDLNELKQWVYNVHRVVFLGFGFHRQNIDILASDPPSRGGKMVMGTIMNEPVPAVTAYKRRLMEALAVTGEWELIDDNCEAFMEQYSVLLGD